jgi:sulfotransferase
MIFFNSSMPRSGSTLMQNILAQNPSVHVTPTDGLLELLYGARAQFTGSPEFKAQDQETMKRAWQQFCLGGLTGYASALSDKPHTCIKSRGIGIHYKWFESFMGPPKIICMVRDIKSVLSSMERMFQANQDRHQDVLNHAEMRGTTLEKRLNVWLNSAPVGLALERFYEMIRTGTIANCLVIRYEDLVLNPEGVLGAVYRYLGIESFDHDFSKVDQVTKEDDTIYGLSSTLHRIDSVVEDKHNDYTKVLNENLCFELDKTYFWYQKYFGYIGE